MLAVFEAKQNWVGRTEKTNEQIVGLHILTCCRSPTRYCRELDRPYQPMNSLAPSLHISRYRRR